MLEVSVIVTVLLYAGWACLLYRLHVALETIDPDLCDRIGKPSPFWTPFNGNAHLVQLIRRRDLGSSRYAALHGQARVMRVWAVATIAATVWLLWAYARAPLA